MSSLPISAALPASPSSTSPGSDRPSPASSASVFAEPASASPAYARSTASFEPVSPFATIARFTIIDGLRSRWALVVLALIGAALALGAFGGSLALTESGAVSLVAFAPVLRVASVLAIIVFVAAATVHEIDERSRLMMLAAPLSRSGWVLARFTGIAVLATMTAAACALPLLVFHLPGTGAGSAAWLLSLALELIVVGGLTLMMACSLAQVPSAVLAASGCYLLARVIGAAMLLNERAPLADQRAVADAGSFVLDAIGLLMPRLDLFTQTPWLLGATPADLPAVIGQAVLYSAIVVTLAAIDFGARDA